MRIDHLIAGKTVAGRDYFETVVEESLP